MRHPFEPVILENSHKILIGTLPPENVTFYFSNSSNTRLWDLLKTILEKREKIIKGSNELSKQEKIDILGKLSLGITDIILEYSRKNFNSTKDADIIPEKYNDIISLVEKTRVDTLLFVYESAARWFLHSLEKEAPLTLSGVSKLIKNIDGMNPFKKLIISGREVDCVLLPNPLNRGKKGMTLQYKIDIYKKFIFN